MQLMMLFKSVGWFLFFFSLSYSLYLSLSVPFLILDNCSVSCAADSHFVTLMLKYECNQQMNDFVQFICLKIGTLLQLNYNHDRKTSSLKSNVLNAHVG